jgi:hypothetical protein
LVVKSAFAMTGALAWQVKKPNKIFIFVFSGEEMARGLIFIFTLALLRRGVSLFFFPCFCLLQSLLTVWSDTKHKNSQSITKANKLHVLDIDPASSAAAWNFLHHRTP